MSKVTVILGSTRSARSAELDRRFAETAPHSLLLVPSRADARRRQETALAATALPGLWGAPILDLAGFAEQIVAEQGGGVRRVSKLERRLLLERAVHAHQISLTEWLGVDPVTLPGFTSHLLAIIMQLKQAGIEPHVFRDKLDRHACLLPLDQAVACAYEHYQSLLKEANVYDVPGLYWAAEASCRDHSPALLQGKQRVLLDAFDDFTPSELRLLHAIAGGVPELVIGLHYDTRPARRDAYDAPSRGLARLRAVFEDKLEIIDCLETAPEDEAAFLAEHLFWRDTPPTMPPATANVAIIPCIDTRHEAESVARQVRALLDDGASASGIAIALRDTGAPMHLLLAALRQCGIPCKTNLRLPLSVTPAGAALLRFVNMLATWDRETVLDLLSSSILWSEVPADHRDAFALLVRKASILAGEREWEQQLTALSVALEGTSRRTESLLQRLPDAPLALQALRRRFDKLREWAKSFPSEADAAEYIKATRSLLGEWALGGCPDEVTQALWSTLQLLTVHTPPGRTISLGDYAAMLGRALAEVEVPHSTGRSGVHIAAPESLRNQPWSHLFVLGVNEGVYPRPPALNALYTRSDLLRFQQAGLHLEGSDMHAARERLLFLRLLLDSRGGVTLSWRVKKDGDREAMPSPFLTEIEELLKSRPSVRRPVPPAEAIVPVPAEAQSLRDIAGAAARQAAKGMDFLAEQWPAVARGILIEGERWREAPCGPYDGVLEVDVLLESLASDYGPDHVFSVAQLEKWLGCPFQFFQDRVLRIEESTPFEGEFDPRTRGSLLHAVLGRFHERHRGAPLSSIAVEQAEAWMEDDILGVFAPLLARGSGMPIEAVSAERLYLGGLLRRYLAHAYREDADEWRPEAFEKGFGNAPAADLDEDAAAAQQAATPPYRLPLDNGESILLAGRIDRIDLSETGARARIIDYKSGKVPEASEIYGGRSLQLSVYALALTALLYPDTPCTEAHYVPVGRDAWREALGKAPRLNKEAWAMRDPNMRLKIQEALNAIRAGQFPPLPTAKSCYGCGNAKACRLSESRQMRKLPAT